MNDVEESELKKPTRIFGFIKNTKGRPLTGATVKCGKSETITLFDGSYKFEVDPGLHTLNVEFEGFVNQEKEIFVEDNQEGRLDFILEEEFGTSKIFGQIIAKETEEYIKNGLVLLIRPTININSKIDPVTGYYKFDNLPKGTYDIWTSILEYEDKKSILIIGDNEERRHDFYVEKKNEEEVPWG
jgi:hypothetical protein